MKRILVLALAATSFVGTAYARCCPGDCCIAPTGLKRSEAEVLKAIDGKAIQAFGIHLNNKTGRLELISDKKNMVASEKTSKLN